MGGIAATAGTRVHGMKITFMRIESSGLDPSDSYESPRVGEPDQDGAVSLAGEDDFIAGVCGRAGDDLEAIGLLRKTGGR